MFYFTCTKTEISTSRSNEITEILANLKHPFSPTIAHKLPLSNSFRNLFIQSRLILRFDYGKGSNARFYHLILLDTVCIDINCVSSYHVLFSKRLLRNSTRVDVKRPTPFCRSKTEGVVCRFIGNIYVLCE